MGIVYIARFVKSLPTDLRKLGDQKIIYRQFFRKILNVIIFVFNFIINFTKNNWIMFKLSLYRVLRPGEINIIQNFPTLLNIV